MPKWIERRKCVELLMRNGGMNADEWMAMCLFSLRLTRPAAE